MSEIQPPESSSEQPKLAGQERPKPDDEKPPEKPAGPEEKAMAEKAEESIAEKDPDQGLRDIAGASSEQDSTAESQEDSEAKNRQLFENVDAKNAELGGRLAISVGTGENRVFVLPTKEWTALTEPRERQPGDPRVINPTADNYLIITQQGPRLLEVQGDTDNKMFGESSIYEMRSNHDEAGFGFHSNITYKVGEVSKQGEGIRMMGGVLGEEGVEGDYSMGDPALIRLKKDFDPDLASKILEKNVTRAQNEVTESKVDQESNSSATDRLNDILGGK